MSMWAAGAPRRGWRRGIIITSMANGTDLRWPFCA